MKTAALMAAWLCICQVAAGTSNREMGQAVREYNSGLYMRARNRLEAILKKAPQEASAHYLLGCILVKQHHNDLAAAHFNYCLQIGRKEKDQELLEKAATAVKELNKQSKAVVSPAHDIRQQPHLEDNSQALEAEALRLRGEAEAQIAVKKKILSDKLADLAAQEKQALAPLAPVRRRHGGRYVDQEAIDSLKKDFSERRRTLEAQFEKEANDIRQAFERRLQGYEAALKNK